MTALNLPPFLIFFLGALLVPFVHGRGRDALLLLIPIIGGLNLFALPTDAAWHLDLFDYSLMPVRSDELSRLFGWLFHVAAFLGLLFALRVRDTTQDVAALLYAGSAVGVAFAGDLITLLVFWEGLSISSAFLIFARRTPESMRAGMRYLVFNILSGLLLLAGIIVYVHQTGSLVFDYLGLEGTAAWLIFLAFGIKAGFPLLHNWITDGYPAATATGTVFLSAFTTKCAIYALARSFPGTEALIYIGAVMTCFPIFYAVIENDLRRVLAYSMINQLGFMVCGIGVGTALAINGAVAHAFNDMIFKGLLFMSMGAVLHVAGTTRASELGGLYKTMPRTAVLCIIGAISISAFPLFNGFVSKTMIMQALLDEGYGWVWVALLFASAGVMEHAGIKVPYFGFFAHDSGLRVREPPRNMLAAMALGAGLCIAIGVYPWLLYNLLPFELDYSPYDLTHVLTQLQLLLFAALAIVWLHLSGRYPAELPAVNLDAEWFYRRLVPHAARNAAARLTTVHTAVTAYARARLDGLIGTLFRHHGPQGVLARTWPSGNQVLWVALLLGVYLMFYYAFSV